MTQPSLTPAERQFLTFALDLAFDAMVSGDGFTDEDEAALERFRRMAGGDQQMTPIEHPLRAKHAGTGPVHAARSILAGGHNTACLVWLDPTTPHQWLPDGTTVTCSACERALTREASR